VTTFRQPWRHAGAGAFLLCLSSCFAQQVSFRITPLRPVAEARDEALKAHPPVEQGSFRAPDLVELVRIDPSIKLDVRYATTNNFLGEPLYTEPRAFLERPAAEALVRAHRSLRAQGFGLIIHDGYRPWYVTDLFWLVTPDDKKKFVANQQRARSTTGAAPWICLSTISRKGRKSICPAATTK